MIKIQICLTEVDALKFINKQNLEIISITPSANPGSSWYRVWYKEKKAEACEINWESEYLRSKFLLSQVLDVFQPRKREEGNLLETIERFIQEHQHSNFDSTIS